MRNPAVASYLVVLVASVLWSQQVPAPQQNPATSTPVVRNPHSTKEDLAVPLCPATFDDSLATDGIVGRGTDGVTRPKPKHLADPRPSDEAVRLKRSEGVALLRAKVTFVVDMNGNPRDLCLSESAGYGIDLEAAKAIQQSKFIPAIKDGKPVPVRISMIEEVKLH